MGTPASARSTAASDPPSAGLSAPGRPPEPLRLDFCSQAAKHHPFPLWAQLRAAGPVARVRVPLFGNVWMATTYDAVNELLRDHQRFLQNPAAAGHRWMGMLLRWLPRSLRPLTTQMLMRDEPDHRRLRRLVEQAFQRQSVEALRPRLVALADDALDRLEQAGQAQSGQGQPRGVDLLEHFARPFPLAVICELLGLPPEDRPKFTRWAAGFSTARSAVGIFWGLRGLSSMMRYLKEEIARQSVRPREGLLSSLIQAEEQGDRLSEEELVAMVFLLLAAGHETTLHQICGSVVILLDHPQHLRELASNWRAADSTVQELLRYLSFAQVSKPRYARSDTEFQGQTIRRGKMIFACLASANSDPAQFEDPERFDPHREPNRHVAFGSGIHYCLGAKLSSVELEIALERLFTRWPDLRLAVPRDKLRYLPRFGTRALTALPVAW
jgi:cytochrome P450